MGAVADRGILGCAALWGEVVEGTRGWRASHGYPRLLIADPGVGRRALTRLGDRYGVPVHVSPVSVPALVGMLDTTLREYAEGLRNGVMTWAEVCAAIR
jgi:hypothetical protein